MKQSAEAKMAGCAYLSYIVFAMSRSILFAKATAGDDISQTLSTLNGMIWTARITVLMDLLQIVCALLLAVTLYQLVKAIGPHPRLARHALPPRRGPAWLSPATRQA